MGRTVTIAPMRRGAGAALVAALLALVVQVVAVPPATAAEVSVPDGSGGFDVGGRGFGHGRGMSQWGAQGGALQGRTAAQVLAFYYPGSNLDELPHGPVRVRLSDDSDLVVRANASLRLTDQATGVAISWSGLGTSARVARASDGFLRIQYRSGAAWVDARNPAWPSNRVSGPVVLTGLPTYWVSLPGGIEREYRGGITVHRTTAGIDVVNALDMEQYLYGVVPREAPSWFAPAALQAQAVAARSYAWSNCSGGNARYDVLDTTSCQVYGGKALISSGVLTSQETPQATAAVDATRHRVLRRSGAVVRAEFSSSNGGWTVANGPWPAQQDPWDGADSRNTNHTWTARVSGAQVQRAWPAVGTLRSVDVLSRDGNGATGGRLLSLRITGSSGSVTASGQQVRDRLGLKSTLVAFGGGAVAGQTDGDIVVVGTGPSTRVTSVATQAGLPLVTGSVISALGASDLSQWRFFAFGDGTAAAPDLVAVRLRGTGSGRVEVHTLTGASGYRTFSTHAATPLPVVPAGGEWELGVASLLGSGAPDLFAVRTRGGASGKVEVHVLSEISGYSRWASQKATAFNQVQPGTMDFIVGDDGQQGALTSVVYGGVTGSGMAEVHRLTATSGWKAFDLHAATSLHLSTTSTFRYGWGDYDRDGTFELYALKLQGTGSGTVEVHVLDDVGGFRTWIAHRATSVPTSAGTTANVRMW